MRVHMWKTYQLEPRISRHWIPTRSVMAPISMPRSSSSPAWAELRSATVLVCWQHWIAPVEQLLPSSGVGAATTRVTRAAATKAKLNCIMRSKELSTGTWTVVVGCSSEESPFHLRDFIPFWMYSAHTMAKTWTNIPTLSYLLTLCYSSRLPLYQAPLSSLNSESMLLLNCPSRLLPIFGSFVMLFVPLTYFDNALFTLDVPWQLQVEFGGYGVTRVKPEAVASNCDVTNNKLFDASCIGFFPNLTGSTVHLTSPSRTRMVLQF